MKFWTIRVIDVRYHMKKYDEKSEQTERKHWIINHIHATTQILDVMCNNKKLLSTSVLINNDLRNEHCIAESLVYYYRATDDEINDFFEAYDEWLELYKIPILTDVEIPIMAEVKLRPKENNDGIFHKIKNLFQTLTTRNAYPVSNKFYVIDNDNEDDVY